MIEFVDSSHKNLALQEHNTVNQGEKQSGALEPEHAGNNEAVFHKLEK